jgi:branched-chain amino acid transport system substrate-binding protein
MTEPIIIGMVNMEASTRGSTQDARVGAEAAVAHVNEVLGGVNGRFIDLVVRTTQSDPESSVTCAKEMVARAPVAIMGGADYYGAGAVPVYAGSGIPIVGGPAFADAEYEQANIFKFAPYGKMTWPGLAIHAIEELGAERIAVVFPDNGPGNGAVNGFMVPVITAKGAECIRVPFTPGWRNEIYAGAATDAVDAKPDAVITFGPAHACRGVLAQLKDRNPDVPLYTSTIAFASSIVEGGGKAALEGVYTVSAFDCWGDSDEAQAYRNAIRSFVYRDELDEMGIVTFSSVMNLYALLLRIDPDAITQDSILAALRAARGEASFMGHPYTFDGQQVPRRPGLGSGHTRIIQVGAGMSRTFATDWVDHTALLP